MAAIPAVAIAVYLTGFDGGSKVDDFLEGNRTNVYRTTATISGTLLGFSIAAVSLVLTFVTSERLALLRGSPHFPSLMENVLSGHTIVLEY